MYYYSTRDEEKKHRLSAGEAMLQGLAPDGGLYVPSEFPSLPENLSADMDYSSFAYEVLKPYFAGDELEDSLEEICRSAFSFPVPLNNIGEAEVLELFHGPTSAFKDFGARFLAFSMERLLDKSGKNLTILVATSGDTGGAVASAFHNRRHLSVKVLFPKGRVAERQKKQLTCWDGNIEAFEVDGSFDDCQKMVKDAFMDKSLTGLSSANSINLGRLLPQMVYYVYSSMLYEKRHGKKPVIIVPSGNVGNSTGAFWAMKMGAPIERVVLAVNANRTIPDYLESGTYTPRASVKTLANAMDVGAPSNMERLFSLFTTLEERRAYISSWSVSDDEIRKTIKSTYDKCGYILCPHTACAEYVRETHFADAPVIIVSTAHPAKFESIVEPLINTAVPVPPALAALLDSESRYKDIAADYHLLFS